MTQAYTQNDVDRLLSRLTPLSSKLTEEGVLIARQTRPCPETLFHYSDTNALIGIVEKQELWATDVGFVNDESELVWSKKVFGHIISEIEPRDKKETDLLARMQNASDLTESGLGLYIASFSEEPDDLTQWRGYGNGQGPVCIGFHSQLLEMYFSSCELISVIYDEEEQKEIARRIVNLTINFYRDNLDEENPASDMHYIGHCVSMFRKMTTYASLRFKAPQWRSEREWRLVFSTRSGDLPDNLSFRSGSYGLIPFVKLKIDLHPQAFRIPIDHLIVGPTSHRQLAVRSAEIYMRRHRYMLREGVVASSVSLR